MRDVLTLSVVSHGHGALLARLLAQLNAASALRGIAVFVTLNLADEPLDVARYQNLALEVRRNDTPRGFGQNHNAAFGRCTTPCFGILNPDLALAASEPFTALVERLLAERDSGAVAPQVLSAAGSVEDSVRANLTPASLFARQLLRRRERLDTQVPARRGVPFYWLAGMCLVVDSQAFRFVGGFDERYFLYCEDYDLCARLYLSGRSLVVEPRARIVHDARRDSHGSLRHLRWHLQSLLKVWTSTAFWRVTLGRHMASGQR